MRTKRRRKARLFDPTDDRLNVSTTAAADILGISWLIVLQHQKSGRLPSVRVGVKSQPYYRTSMKALFDFMQDRVRPEGGTSGDTEPTG